MATLEWTEDSRRNGVFQARSTEWTYTVEPNGSQWVIKGWGSGGSQAPELYRLASSAESARRIAQDFADN